MDIGEPVNDSAVHADPPQPEFVDIDGHKVPAHMVDLFYNMSDGSRVTDEQWDESKRRYEAAVAAEKEQANG